MNWSKIKQFNFTYELDGGAWVKDEAGTCNWYPTHFIVRHLGQEWFDRQMKKTGMFPGCWIDIA
jgi:hypothetical protein